LGDSCNSVDNALFEAPQSRLMSTWFDTARFGMFIHWGHCSQRGLELSWPLVGGSSALPGGKSVADRFSEAFALRF